KPDAEVNRSERRELHAKHGVKRLMKKFIRTERHGSQAGVPELLQVQENVSKRSASAAASHREAMTSLAEASAASADANDPQAMMARDRLAKIRKELNGER